ncbi:hypothetical protein N431DRAFT_554474, partial [Stipitochalara longipes BDJ]
MSTSKFKVKDHTIPCQHIREEFITSSTSDPKWHMQVKQYTPLCNPSPKEGDITIIASHVNGFPRELYEPFWDDLLATLSTQPKPINIRNIWIITPAHFYSSLNPSHHDSTLETDTARDILYLTNHFSAQMLHPILGIGHSIGASQLTSVSLIHPSLFTGLVLIEPIIADEREVKGIGRDELALLALKRKRVWGSREEAEKYFERAWRGWDARVREKWKECALVDIGGGNGKVELAWGRAQELAVYMDMSEMRMFAATDEKVEGKGKGSAVWTQYPAKVWEGLRDLVVPVAFVCGEESTSSTVECQKYWKEETGTNRRYWPKDFERSVDLVEMKGAGHLAPLEKPKECAGIVGRWIVGEMVRWWVEWDRQRRWRLMGREEKEKVIENWMTGLKSR